METTELKAHLEGFGMSFSSKENLLMLAEIRDDLKTIKEILQKGDIK